jgi:hypothetical protein
VAVLLLPHPPLTQGPHDTAVVVQQSHEGIDQADLKSSTMFLFLHTPKLGVDAEGRLESPRLNKDHRPSWQDSCGVNLLKNPRCHWRILVARTSILLYQRVRNASVLEMGY